jgi:hypothetical protein
MNPTSCLFGSWFAENPVFVLAGTLLFDEKIRSVLVWIGSWNSLLMSRNPKTNDVSPQGLSACKP